LRRPAAVAGRGLAANRRARLEVPKVVGALVERARVGEDVRLLRIGHRDLGVLVEVEMQARRAALGGPDEEEGRVQLLAHGRLRKNPWPVGRAIASSGRSARKPSITAR